MNHSKLFIILALCAILILLFLDIFNILFYRNSIQKIQEKNAQSLINTINASILKECEECLFNNDTLPTNIHKDTNERNHNLPLHSDTLLITKIIEKGFSQFVNSSSITYILVETQDSIIAISNHSILSDLLREKKEAKQLSLTNVNNFKYKVFGNSKILEVSKAIEIPNMPPMQVRLGYDIKMYETEFYNILSYSIYIGIFSILLSIVIIVYFATLKNSDNLRNTENNVEKAFRKLFDNFAEGIVILDKKKYIKYINQSASDIFEIDKLSIINKHYNEYFDFDYFNIDNVINSASPSTEMNVVLTTRNRNIKYLSYTTGLVEMLLNKSKLVLIVLNDITEQVKSQKQAELEERKAIIEKIADSLADRIKNPLNAIYLIINQMEQSNIQELNPSSIKTLKEEIKNINNAIEVFIEYAKPIDIKLKKSNLADICDDIVTTYSNITDSKRITIHKDYPIYVPVEIDPDLIKQSISKLLQKSLSSIENEGDIIISIKNDKDNTIIHITDNGKGMSDFEIADLFSFNFSSENDINSLELAKIKQVVQLHKGNLKVDSKRGYGTTYEITLPK